jgi:hypothetical protein
LKRFRAAEICAVTFTAIGEALYAGPGIVLRRRKQTCKASNKTVMEKHPFHLMGRMLFATAKTKAS